MQLKALSKLNKRISSIQIKILQYLCRHPSSTVYELCKKRALERDIDIRTLRRDICDLSDKGLIRRLQKENIEHKAKPCTVTTAGIIYLILTRNILYKSIIRDIFENYGDNMLFELFIYPIISRDTLLQLGSFNSLSPIELFLYDCSREIIHTLESIDTPRNRNVMEQIFVWQNIPHNKQQTNRLLGFLKQKFNLNWLDSIDVSNIEKTRNKIRISHRADAISITLDHTNTKAILKIRGQKEKCEFIVQKHSTDCYIVAAPTEPVEEFNATSLAAVIQQRIPSFLFNLLSNVVAGSSDFHILSHDKRLMQIVKMTKKKLDDQYEMFVKI